MTIMDIVLIHGNLTPKEVGRFNRCRKYYKVHFLSDILTGSGNALNPMFYDHQLQNRVERASKWDWPKANPSGTDWDLWQLTLAAIFPDPGMTTTLFPQLGPWVRESHRPETWFWNPYTEQLLLLDTDQWIAFEKR